MSFHKSVAVLLILLDIYIYNRSLYLNKNLIFLCTESSTNKTSKMYCRVHSKQKIHLHYRLIWLNYQDSTEFYCTINL